MKANEKIKKKKKKKEKKKEKRKEKKNRSKDQNDIWSNLKTWISDHPIFNINLYFSCHQCHLYSVTCLHEYFKYRKSTKQKQKAKPYLHWITLKTLLFKIDKSTKINMSIFSPMEAVGVIYIKAINPHNINIELCQYHIWMVKSYRLI